MTFPQGFTWGVASSAYQIEGAVREGGRGWSVWDAFCRRHGAIREAHTGDVACDHYHRYTEDVDLIAALGVSAYRLSVSWPRVLPHGIGARSAEGIGFYDRLVDRLLERGVTPWITLFHWDFPLELFRAGGWLNRDSARWFAEYASVVAEHLGDRVKHFITLNEPQCFLGLGHHLGVHAPGIRYPPEDVLLATHHALLAHGHAVTAIRASVRDARIGWSPVGWTYYPVSDHPAAVERARELMFEIPADPQKWPLNNAWYSDPVVLGRYPEEGVARFGGVPGLRPGDLEVISQPLDFYGVNIYHGVPIGIDPETEQPVRVSRAEGHAETMMAWTVDPLALHWGPRFLAERYGLPVYVTENGIATMDWVHVDGHIHDGPRIDYLARHLISLRAAIDAGVDVRGYFQWSIMDNFEWELGYSKRFGLLYVDYATQERVAKDSYYWYADLVRTNGANLPRHPAPLR